jgi:cbb3-type cytochrome oxidase subunit 3
MEWLMWFTQFENTKPLALVIFFTLFCAILFYVFGSKGRSQRLESYKNMPFLDEYQDAKGN